MRRSGSTLNAFFFMGKQMPGINFTFGVVDKFSQAMDKFSKKVGGLTDKSEKLDESLEDVDKTTKKVSGSAEKAGLSFGGFGASMLIVNQALQAFQRLSEPIKQALDDISDKERAVIQLGKDAGEQFNQFARDAANAMGRTESEIRKAGFRWRETGIGGSEIMRMTELADRFANLNPGRSFEDVANALNDAVKSKNSGSLAELLGGGEGVERKLLRSGVERSLKRGDVSGAMEKFKEVADGFGYTQKRADEMGMTIDRKIEKITSIVRNKFTEMFSGVVARAEPFIDKILGWLESEDATAFFDRFSKWLVIVIAFLICGNVLYMRFMFNFPSISDVLYGTLFIVSCLLISDRIKFKSKYVLPYLGKNSLFYWLLSGIFFFNTKELLPAITWPSIPVFMLIWVLLLLTPFVFACDWVSGKITGLIIRKKKD